MAQLLERRAGESHVAYIDRMQMSEMMRKRGCTDTGRRLGQNSIWRTANGKFFAISDPVGPVGWGSKTVPWRFYGDELPPFESLYAYDYVRALFSLVRRLSAS